jgi:hypothetical protein
MRGEKEAAIVVIGAFFLDEHIIARCASLGGLAPHF